MAASRVFYGPERAAGVQKRPCAEFRGVFCPFWDSRSCNTVRFMRLFFSKSHGKPVNATFLQKNTAPRCQACTGQKRSILEPPTKQSAESRH